MTAKTYKWTVFGIISAALCGWLVRISLIHAALVQQLTDTTKVREAQLQTISTWKELDQGVRSARDRETRECGNLTAALRFCREKRISGDVLKSFDMSNDYSLYTRNGIGNGFFLQTDEESEVIAFVRTLSPEEGEKPACTQLKQTIESPNLRVILPNNSHHLTEYQFDTFGTPGKLEFGCHLTDSDGTRFVPFCDVTSSYDNSVRKGSDGPYDDGILKNREFRVTYGWPDLCELDFVQALQKRGIWFIGCNELFWLDQSEVLHVVLVFASRREWRIHPDYLYGRSLNSGFDLEWDPQQDDYIATPKPAK
jgi:hypothetical protein